MTSGDSLQENDSKMMQVFLQFVLIQKKARNNRVCLNKKIVENEI